MANYSELIATINEQIKANGNQEITGPVLNAVLKAMVSALGEGYQFMGVATPTTNPGTPDERVFYIAVVPGNYANFSVEIAGPSIITANASGSWSVARLLLPQLLDDAYAQALCGKIKVIRDFLFSYDGSTGSFVTSKTYDCLIIPILPGSTGRIAVDSTDVPVPFSYVFLEDIVFDGTSLTCMSNASGNIPNDTVKWCVVDIKKANNPNTPDYVNVYQSAAAVKKIDINSIFKGLTAAFAGANNKSEVEVEWVNGYYSSALLRVTSVAGYSYAKIDVSQWTGDFLQVPIAVNGIEAIAFTDERNWPILVSISESNDAGNSTSIRCVYGTVCVPKGAKWLYVNISTQINTNCYKVFRLNKLTLCSYDTDIVPYKPSVIDAAAEEGKAIIIDNVYVDLDTNIGMVIPIPTWYCAFVKIKRSKQLTVKYDKQKVVIYGVAWFTGNPFNKDNYYASSTRSSEAIFKNEQNYGVDVVVPFSSTTATKMEYAVFLFRKTDQLSDGLPQYFEVEQSGTLASVKDALEEKSYVDLTIQNIVDGYFVLPDGTTKANSYYQYYEYLMTAVPSEIKRSDIFIDMNISINTNIYAVFYYNSDDVLLDKEYYMNTATYGNNYAIKGIKLHIPVGTAKIRVNRSKAGNSRLYYNEKQGVYVSSQSPEQEQGEKSLKVTVHGLTTNLNSSLFEIRSKYNATKDIIRTYNTNGNGCVTNNSVYIGPNDLDDAALMTSQYLVNSPTDSTAPFFSMPEYWHLFAQHGYVIPIINNTVNMTEADVGAVWKDQLDREYTIGKVSGSYIYLLPVFTNTAEGSVSRGWKTPNSTKPTHLTHVSGGSYTTEFDCTYYAYTQLRPIMQVHNRRMLADGVDITKAGTYYCDNFKVSEEQDGYDPVTINTWFPEPDLSGAQIMAKFTWGWNFHGNSCAVNTTVSVLRKLKCQSYGACQQQFFYDSGNYKAMFLIPKLKTINGVDPSRPFNSPASSSTYIAYTRDSESLVDVNDPVDRQIGYLYDDSSDDYKVGLAAGLSLVTGDTVKSKRIQNIPISSADNGYDRLGSFSPSNTNKFYIAAINAMPFADDEYNLPNTYFKEINYYVSYFDPAENSWGQVYTYKDGNAWIVYIHCQKQLTRQKVVLPEDMEGAILAEIVEKTDNAELLTDAVANGVIYVNFSSATPGWIVAKFS